MHKTSTTAASDAAGASSDAEGWRLTDEEAGQVRDEIDAEDEDDDDEDAPAPIVSVSRIRNTSVRNPKICAATGCTERAAHSVTIGHAAPSHWCDAHRTFAVKTR